MMRALSCLSLAALLVAAPTFAATKSSGDATTDALHRLLIKEEIRDTLAHYNQLVDRDDGAPNRHEWLTRMFTEDAEMLAFYPDGKPDIDIRGRDAIEKKFGGGDPTDNGLASKHYIVNVVFDEVSDTRVRTHINALSVTTTKNIVDRHCAGCGNQPVSISMFVYDNIWVKTGGEWKISRMSVQFKN
jgi:hypothetical protein